MASNKSIFGESEANTNKSCVSLKSNQSVEVPLNLSSEESSAVERESLTGNQLDSVFEELEHKTISIMKKEQKNFKKLLSPECSERGTEEEDDQTQFRGEILKITLDVLGEMNQKDLANTLHTKHAPSCMTLHKCRLAKTFQAIYEGISIQGRSRLLHEIYTDLYITKGGSGGVNNEHEVRQTEVLSRRSETHEAPISCNDIFKASPGQMRHIRTVLTKGVAGIGKTVSVQKFILDWAEGKANPDVHFVFPIPFRELNLIKNDTSLMELLCQFFKDINELRVTDFDNLKVLFILDGLDECRLSLDFQNNDILLSVTESASVDVLLTNLIKGNLLPSALLWITSRPAAANQIPPDFVDQVTEVRGFNDPQKDEYFKKRIKDPSLANRIITHIKSTRTFYIMCHIPVFCWISATVLERMLSEAESAEIPKTLTQMYTHYLIFQTTLRTQKYDGKCEVDLQQTKKSIFSLGKLAYEQLQKNNLIFYEEDLRECGIDVKEASVFSGLCTQIFRENIFALHPGKVYSFVHMSFQEFLAAFFRLLNKDAKCSITDILKSEVDRALRYENGHFDLYLRFLLGLSMEPNEIFQDLLTDAGDRSDSKQEITDYIKKKIKEDLSPEKSISLFHCLNELNDQSLVQEVQKYLRRTDAYCLTGITLSPDLWSALVFVLLNPANKLDEFKLSKFCKSEEGLLRLIPVIKASRKADLSDCNLTEKSCLKLASVLKSKFSDLRELNLNYNNLQDSKLKVLSDGLKNPQCKLERLKLYNCSIRAKDCADLTAALESNPSNLRELDLSWNTLEDSGIKQFSGLLMDPYCQLEKLELAHCSIGEESCAALVSALRSNPSHLRELNLNFNTIEDSGVTMLSNLLKNQRCKLERLQLECCSIGELGCAAVLLALESNPSHLKELNLSENKLGDSGAELLSGVLKDCKLEKLQLSDCALSENGCVSLVLALKSNLSNLRELNLSKNNPGNAAVKLISGLLKDQDCKLEKLKLELCNIGEEGCAVLASAVRSNPSHLRELNLNYNKPGEFGMKQLSELQKSCTLKKLEFCSIDYIQERSLQKPIIRSKKTSSGNQNNCFVS